MQSTRPELDFEKTINRLEVFFSYFMHNKEDDSDENRLNFLHVSQCRENLSSLLLEVEEGSRDEISEDDLKELERELYSYFNKSKLKKSYTTQTKFKTAIDQIIDIINTNQPNQQKNAEINQFLDNHEKKYKKPVDVSEWISFTKEYAEKKEAHSEASIKVIAERADNSLKNINDKYGNAIKSFKTLGMSLYQHHKYPSSINKELDELIDDKNVQGDYLVYYSLWYPSANIDTIANVIKQDIENGHYSKVMFVESQPINVEPDTFYIHKNKNIVYYKNAIGNIIKRNLTNADIGEIEILEKERVADKSGILSYFGIGKNPDIKFAQSIYSLLDLRIEKMYTVASIATNSYHLQLKNYHKTNVQQKNAAEKQKQLFVSLKNQEQEFINQILGNFQNYYDNNLNKIIEIKNKLAEISHQKNMHNEIIKDQYLEQLKQFPEKFNTDLNVELHHIETTNSIFIKPEIEFATFDDILNEIINKNLDKTHDEISDLILKYYTEKFNLVQKNINTNIASLKNTIDIRFKEIKDKIETNKLVREKKVDTGELSKFLQLKENLIKRRETIIDSIKNQFKSLYQDNLNKIDDITTKFHEFIGKQNKYNVSIQDDFDTQLENIKALNQLFNDPTVQFDETFNEVLKNIIAQHMDKSDDEIYTQIQRSYIEKFNQINTIIHQSISTFHENINQQSKLLDEKIQTTDLYKNEQYTLKKNKITVDLKVVADKLNAFDNIYKNAPPEFRKDNQYTRIILLKDSDVAPIGETNTLYLKYNDQNKGYESYPYYQDIDNKILNRKPVMLTEEQSKEISRSLYQFNDNQEVNVESHPDYFISILSKLYCNDNSFTYNIKLQAMESSVLHFKNEITKIQAHLNADIKTFDNDILFLDEAKIAIDQMEVSYRKEFDVYEKNKIDTEDSIRKQFNAKIAELENFMAVSYENKKNDSNATSQLDTLNVSIQNIKNQFEEHIKTAISLNILKAYAKKWDQDIEYLNQDIQKINIKADILRCQKDLTNLKKQVLALEIDKNAIFLKSWQEISKTLDDYVDKTAIQFTIKEKPNEEYENMEKFNEELAKRMEVYVEAKELIDSHFMQIAQQPLFLENPLSRQLKNEMIEHYLKVNKTEGPVLNYFNRNDVLQINAKLYEHFSTLNDINNIKNQLEAFDEKYKSNSNYTNLLLEIDNIIDDVAINKGNKIARVEQAFVDAYWNMRVNQKLFVRNPFADQLEKFINERLQLEYKYGRSCRMPHSIHYSTVKPDIMYINQIQTNFDEIIKTDKIEDYFHSELKYPQYYYSTFAIKKYDPELGVQKACERLIFKDMMTHHKLDKQYAGLFSEKCKDEDKSQLTTNKGKFFYEFQDLQLRLSQDNLKKTEFRTQITDLIASINKIDVNDDGARHMMYQEIIKTYGIAQAKAQTRFFKHSNLANTLIQFVNEYLYPNINFNSCKKLMNDALNKSQPKAGKSYEEKLVGGTKKTKM